MDNRETQKPSWIRTKKGKAMLIATIATFVVPEHETDADQAKFVKKLMQTIITKQKNRNQSVNPKGITGITLWGLCDATSWRSQCAPLLFDTSIYDPKLSYTAFLEAAKIW